MRKRNKPASSLPYRELLAQTETSAAGRIRPYSGRGLLLVPWQCSLPPWPSAHAAQERQYPWCAGENGWQRFAWVLQLWQLLRQQPKQQPQSVPPAGQLLPTGVVALWQLQREEQLRGSVQRFSCLLDKSSRPQWRHGKPRQFCAHFCALNHQEHLKRLPRQASIPAF